MKLRRHIQCTDCPVKCDVHRTLTTCNTFPDSPMSFHASFRKHERICRQSCGVSHAIYLVEGIAKLYIEGINDHNIILYLMKPPAYIGLLSFFQAPVYSYSVTALEDSRVCMIELDFLRQLYLENHALLLSLNEAFGKSVALIMNKLISLNQKNTRGRVAESLLYLADFYSSDRYRMPVTRKELGEMSAISEETTVRLLTEFRKEHIIEIEGRDVQIMDKKLLRKISDLG
ncbi:MAG TPA: Crp/Fnr family transcriptional regulator [Bacteroidales bacterium]|nr:Crp/Fnr family transcriptional regulator [Bacteroidales bacterium]HSA42854.1 Crp/Fnr family transcriptional regulator [Bacteroidales bacterium]